MVTTTCLSPASISTARPASVRKPREALRTASACCENTPRSVRARNSRRCASASEGQSPGLEYQRFSSWLSPREYRTPRLVVDADRRPGAGDYHAVGPDRLPRIHGQPPSLAVHLQPGHFGRDDLDP